MSDEYAVRASGQRQLLAGNRTAPVRAQVMLLQIIDALRKKAEAHDEQIRRQGDRIDRTEAESAKLRAAIQRVIANAVEMRSMVSESMRISVEEFVKLELAPTELE